MTLDLARNWWLVALRGVLAIVLGVLAFLWPAATLAVLVFLFGAYALIDGIFAIISAIRAADRGRRWWPVAVEGVAGVLAGVLFLLFPAVAAVALVLFIGVWAIVTGVLELIAAIRLRREIENEWLLGLGGVLSVLFGVALFFFPEGGALALIWIVGAYALVFGVVMLALGFRLRAWQSRAGVTADARVEHVAGAPVQAAHRRAEEPPSRVA